MNSQISKLLATDSYIQVNKGLIKSLGLHEAILLGELCAEYNYWESQNKLEDNMFYSTRENIEENTGLNEHFQRKAMKTLQDAGILTIKRKGVPSKNYYGIDFDKILTSLTTSRTPRRGLVVKTVDLNNNNNKNKQLSLSKDNDINESKHNSEPGSFLGSAGKKQKKSSMYSQCVALIYDFTDDKEIRQLLITYLGVRLEMNTPLGVKQWKGLLHALSKLDNQVEVIQQSINRGYRGFFPVNSYSKKADNLHDRIGESGARNVPHITPEEEEELQRRVESGELPVF